MSNFRRQDMWRSHPLLTNGMKDAFPGFKRAVKIFAVYIVAEQIYKLATTPIGGHDDGHRHHGSYEWKKQGLGQPPQLAKADHEEHHH
jgi:NADH-ubiquinone oxidoreductase B12 subunit family